MFGFYTLGAEPPKSPGASGNGGDMATAEMTDQKKVDQKEKALDTALTQIERAYGKGARSLPFLGPLVAASTASYSNSASWLPPHEPQPSDRRTQSRDRGLDPCPASQRPQLASRMSQGPKVMPPLRSNRTRPHRHMCAIACGDGVALVQQKAEGRCYVGVFGQRRPLSSIPVPTGRAYRHICAASICS